MTKATATAPAGACARKYLLLLAACGALVLAGGCGSVTNAKPDARGNGGGPDAALDAPTPDTMPGAADAATDATSAACTPNQALRCEGDNLITCNSAGTAEVSTACSLGCNGTQLRCNDIDPSNGLAQYLDVTDGEPSYNFSAAATIDTDTGAVKVGGKAVTIKSFVVQTATPKIRVFAVGSLTTMDVTVTGTNALAIVSNGDVKIEGIFSVSASGQAAGPGGLNDPSCNGKPRSTTNSSSNPADAAEAGAGGAGFGSPGGSGGNAHTADLNAIGGTGGPTNGSPTLVPLRGGCNGGDGTPSVRGYGGGAVQLASRTQIVVDGVVAANGTGGGGGGSGGGILLEAPIVKVPGNLVANGGGGGSCTVGSNGGTDATPAPGGTACTSYYGVGGNGAAGSSPAGNGLTATVSDQSVAIAGNGGGGVGRIRINVLNNALTKTGIISPSASVGDVAIR